MMKRIGALLGALLLVLCCAASALGEDVLPPYKYPGDDPLTAAIAEYTAGLGENYYREENCVAIPAPVVFKTVYRDENHARVYGNFWVNIYKPEGTTLICLSGGEAPAIMDLEKTETGWKVTNFTVTGDGDEYASGITAFCNGDTELERQYFESADLNEEPCKSVRTAYIRDYVQANGLNMTAYQDPYWEPILLKENG